MEEESKFSDHRPAYALFSVQIDSKRPTTTPPTANYFIKFNLLLLPTQYLRGDILVVIDFLEKAGKFKEAATLILAYVLSNSLWSSGKISSKT